MTRAVLYVAAPLRPTEEEINAIPSFTMGRGRGEYEPDMKVFVAREARVHPALRANIDRALRWLAWLRKSFPETTFIAPWIASVLAGADDTDPAQREAGMADACAVVERCDGIVLCGGRISEGMRREMEHGRARYMTQEAPNYFEIYDISWLCYDPNDLAGMDPSPGMSFDRWHAAVLHGRTA